MWRATVVSIAVPASAAIYCPVESDLSGSGNVQWHDNGWTVTGEGGVHGKTSFNLLGGWIEFEMDTTGAHGGINNNFYTTSPQSCCDYCDIQPNGSPQCMEMDIIENNGNCLGQTTWHTWPNKNGDCDENGCWGQKYLPSSPFKMTVEWSDDGWMRVFMNGETIDVSNPAPSNNAKSYMAQTMRTIGAQIQSTQWQGWVPGGNCPGGGDKDSSRFSVRNLRISGSVVSGIEPTRCEPISATPTTTPHAPPPPPPKTPAPAPPPPCVNLSDYCSYWADQGECDKNPGYMQEKCRASCGLGKPAGLVEVTV